MILCTKCGNECEDGLECCNCCGHRFADDEGYITDKEELEEKLKGLADAPYSDEVDPGAMCYAPMP